MRVPFLTTALASSALAQWVAQDDRGLKTLKSPADEGITVSWKEPKGVCKTAFDEQEQYTGWVNVPAPGDVEYETNLFFWFVGAREKTDRLTIWLNGGPGSSSMYGFWTGSGPCEVVEKGIDKYDTIAREWGWDRASNMLFIDQPNKVGFSYNKPTNGTRYLLLDQTVSPPDALNDTVGLPTWSILNGTFNDESDSIGEIQNPNTTQLAAEAVWHMVQGFLTTMPQFKDKESMEVNLFAESYGGTYGPIFAEHFEQQNKKRESGELDKENTRDVNLVSLGILNGIIDMETQAPYYPIFAVNNTYGLKAIKEYEAQYYLNTFNGKGGCKEKLQACRQAVAKDDPEGDGDDKDVNEICENARMSCAGMEQLYYSESGRGPYDIAARADDPFPSGLFEEYLNQASTLKAIGSPVNFSMSNPNILTDFLATGDQARGGNIARLANLLKSGVRVGLMYGDRDYICNWFGGEAVSKEVAKAAGDDYKNGFLDAGYAPIMVNESYTGGVVRQYGNLSFSRVYQSGHAIPAYQPETAFEVFARIIAGTSISNGTEVPLNDYGTDGPQNATHTEKLPEAPKPTCYVRSFGTTCSREYVIDVVGQDDKGELENGGVVVNGKLYKKKEDFPLFGKDDDSDEDDETDGSKTKKQEESGAGDLTGSYTASSKSEGGDDDEEDGAMGLRVTGLLGLTAGLMLYYL